MPRSEYSQKASGRDRRFSELAQLLQLQEAVTGPGREDRALDQRLQQGNMSNALQLMGLHQQGEQARDRSLVDAATLMQQPGANPAALAILNKRFPEVQAATDQARADATAGAVKKMQPQVSAIYGSGMEPGKMKPMLDALMASNPDAFNALPWGDLNAQLQPKPQSTGLSDFFTYMFAPEGGGATGAATQPQQQPTYNPSGTPMINQGVGNFLKRLLQGSVPHN